MTTANPAWDSLPPARTHIRTMQQACGYPRPRSHRSAGRPARAARCSTENKTTPPPPGHTRTHAHTHTHTRTHECPPLAASCRLPAAPPVSRHKGAPAGRCHPATAPGRAGPDGTGLPYLDNAGLGTVHAPPAARLAGLTSHTCRLSAPRAGQRCPCVSPRQSSP